MPGLVPGISREAGAAREVDGRNKSGHDDRAGGLGEAVRRTRDRKDFGSRTIARFRRGPSRATGKGEFPCPRWETGPGRRSWARAAIPARS
ncbi:MAG: hypothetical protein F4X35_08350 [Alphaproteobacteria bacterium]|nr:hypothetical protein [Alphaproteobacteria bacterium]